MCLMFVLESWLMFSPISLTAIPTPYSMSLRQSLDPLVAAHD